MNFLDFCQSHGLIVDYIINDGKPHRVKTVDHPNKLNGAYSFDGVSGWAQNWATMEKAAGWRSKEVFDIVEHRERLKKARVEAQTTADSARKKAAFMLSQSEIKPSAYAEMKGFADHKMHTMERNGSEIILIPMRINGELSTLQVLSYDTEKRAWRKTFLRGGVTKGATFVFGSGQKIILCEGYATGLSAFAAARKAGIDCRVVVCFSANNMLHIAQSVKPWLVIADNDASGTGERVAKQIGANYWMSQIVGNDFNDDHLSRGLFAVSCELKKIAIRRA